MNILINLNQGIEVSESGTFAQEKSKYFNPKTSKPTPVASRRDDLIDHEDKMRLKRIADSEEELVKELEVEDDDKKKKDKSEDKDDASKDQDFDDEESEDDDTDFSFDNDKESEDEDEEGDSDDEDEDES